MKEKKDIITNLDASLINDIRLLLDILNSLVNSYRLLVGAAEEFNRITLAHKKDLEHAIKRADDVGKIIDEVDDELKKHIKTLISKMGCSDDNSIDLKIEL